MEWFDIDWSGLLAWTVVGTLFLVGFVGTALPILPGTVIAFAGVLVHRLWMGADSVSWTFVGFTAGLAALSIVIDVLASWWGAKIYGASVRGAIGAVLGGIIGIFFGLPGLIFGPLLGAFLFEWMDQRPTDEAIRAGFGTFVGGLAAFAIKMTCSVVIIGGFFLALW